MAISSKPTSGPRRSSHSGGDIGLKTDHFRKAAIREFSAIRRVDSLDRRRSFWLPWFGVGDCGEQDWLAGEFRNADP